MPIPVTPAVEHLQGERDRLSPQFELGNGAVQYGENNDVRGVSGGCEDTSGSDDANGKDASGSDDGSWEDITGLSLPTKLQRGPRDIA